eukprot:358750-Pleurochrysis_carterae.AAC.1
MPPGSAHSPVSARLIATIWRTPCSLGEKRVTIGSAAKLGPHLETYGRGRLQKACHKSGRAGRRRVTKSWRRVRKRSVTPRLEERHSAAWGEEESGGPGGGGQIKDWT